MDFVERVSREGGADFVPPAERVAVFDNDGTLWSEKPMPIELGFILQRFTEMAMQDSSLRERQPWKAAYEHDHEWLGAAVTRHYHGDDSDVKVLLGAVLTAFEGVEVEEYVDRAGVFLSGTQHPTLNRGLRECGYLPMVELLRYLESNGFMTYIASGGDRDFMRAISSEIYGISAERVIGSSSALRFDQEMGKVVYKAQPEVFDDGPAKPVRIWSRIGRRPIFAAGNSNGDIPMLRYSGSQRPGMRLLVLHDDPVREFNYVAGAERSLEIAREQSWTVVSMKDDWSTVFAAA